MRYKKSYYNVEIETLENGGVLLFNSNSCAYGAMNPEIKKIYDNIEDMSIEDIEENIKKHIDIMIKNGFLVGFDTNETEMLKVQERLSRYSSNKSQVTLTIAPTTACNMDCPYCYEKKNNQSMDDETKNQLIAFVERITEDTSGLSISWYGGEPLLELDTIRYLSKEFIKICEEKEIKYHASIITNGILLNKETARILADECNINRAQITIDGMREIHNARRRLVDETTDSFNVITNNIDEIKDIISVGIRVNIDKSNYKEMDKLISYFILEKGWTWKSNVGFYFAPVHDMEEACQYGKGNCFTWKEFGELDAFAIKRMHEMGIYEHIQVFYPKRIPYACGALTPSFFVVGPKGELYKCWNYVGNKDRVIGDVKDGIILNKENISWLMMEMPESCEKCKNMPVCRGGCPAQRFDNGNKPACSHHRVADTVRLKLLYENYKNGIGNEQSQCCNTGEKTS